MHTPPHPHHQPPTPLLLRVINAFFHLPVCFLFSLTWNGIQAHLSLFLFLRVLLHKGIKYETCPLCSCDIVSPQCDPSALTQAAHTGDQCIEYLCSLHTALTHPTVSCCVLI